MVRHAETGAGRTVPMEFMLPPTDWVPPTELPDLTHCGPDLAIDCETRDDGLAADHGPGWVHRAGWVTGVSMASGDQSVYVPVRHPDTANFDHDAVGRWVDYHMQSAQRKVFQSAPYDLGWLWAEFGVEAPPSDLLDDTIGMGFVLDENRLLYGLDALCDWQGVPHKDESLLRAAAEAYGYHPKKELWKLPARYVGPYATQDAVSTLGLARAMRPKLELDALVPAYQLEMDILPLCVEMRRRGIRIDTGAIDRVRAELLAHRDRALAELSEKAAIGRQWVIEDVNSNKFMTKAFDAAGVAYPETEKHHNSFSNEWMSKSEHWLPKLCAEASVYDRAGDMFVGKHVAEYTHMGRIHAEIHQFKGEEKGGTVTTRFSYSSPPLQQMPSRVPDIAQRIRGLFLPEEGEVWGTCDYSQQEFRLMVHFAKLCDMAGVDRAVQQYREDPNTDFHDLVAKLTGLPRRSAKDTNFAKAFGAGPPKFALMTGLVLEEAKRVMGQYDDEMPFISRLSEYCQKLADRRGYIRMLDGARGRFDTWEPRFTERSAIAEAFEAARAAGRDLPRTNPCSREEAEARVRDPNHPWKGRLRRAKTHKAMNKLIQGSAARQTKMAMRDMWRAGIVPVLQMHDDLNISCPTPEPAEHAAQIMRDVVRLEVPVKVDVEFGYDWGDAKHTWEEVDRSKMR